MIEHKIETLQKWAQALISYLHEIIELRDEEIARLKAAHAVLTDREWFTISGPSFEDHENFRNLFLLNRNGAHAVCTLGRGDVLLIGRNTRKHEPRFKDETIHCRIGSLPHMLFPGLRTDAVYEPADNQPRSRRAAQEVVQADSDSNSSRLRLCGPHRTARKTDMERKMDHSVSIQEGQMTTPETCGDCDFYTPSNMFDRVGICSLFPGSVTREEHGRPCGIISLIASIQKEQCHGADVETAQ